VVELRILGTLQLSASDGRDLEALARQSKRTALLCYLAAAVPNGLHRRDTLLALFWPELDETHARAALSQALYVLRNALGDQGIVTRGDDEVGLSPDVVWCDVRAFEAALDASQPTEALALYRGGLLDGFFVSDAPEFGRWLDRERERLRECAAEGAWALAEAQSAARDVVQAARWARWAAALAPADEVAIRRLMTFLRGQGDRASALRAYEAFAFRLTQEYELEPSADTRALAETIRREKPPTATATPGDPQPASGPAPGAEPPRPRHQRLMAPALVVAALLGALGFGVVMQRRSAAAPAVRRIAVLPLQNLTGDSTQDYFVDGMHEALIGALARIEAAGVISRTSVLRFRGAERPSLPAIATQLGVDAVVEGSVFRAGDSVRIAVQLIDGRTDQHLWSETYLRDVHDILRLYGELASAVAGQIRIAVTPAERDRLARERQVDPDVYTLTLKGGYGCLLWTEGGIRRGIQLLREAVDRDPTNALAFAKLAGCYSDMSFFGFMPDNEATPLVQAANARALELDSTMGEAYVTRGWFRFVTDHDTDGADQDFRRALGLSPGDLRTRQWYADYLALTGRFDEAIREKRQAIALDPLSAQSSIGLGWTYFYARRYDEAIAQFKRTLNLAPGSYSAHMQLAWNYSSKEVHDVAVAHCDSAFALNPQAENNLFGDCGWVYARAGRREQVLKMLRRIPEPCGAGVSVYVALGDRDQALECLRKEGRENPQSLAFKNFDPMLDPLRSDPRSHAVLRELGIKP
jgi:TolB-like protein/DNA-binding SARP family transcriptional activator/Tfp pilus assembly protein PilF